MVLTDFMRNDMQVNLVLFLIASAVTWFAGSRLSYYADELAERTGLGRVFVGMLLLAGVTSLPEIVTTIVASLEGSILLATNNIFGSITFRTTLVAVADLAAGPGALTVFIPSATILLQGNLLIVILALALAGLVVGELVTFGSLGLWTLLIFTIYVMTLRTMYKYQEDRWKPTSEPSPGALREQPSERKQQAMIGRFESWTRRRLYLMFALMTVLILVGGYLLAQSADALAVQTGLGAGFVGAVLVAAATSLPELSATITAARIGSYALAVANIFGGNAITAALLLVADLSYRDGSIFDVVGRSGMVSLAIGIAMTAVFLIGMVERRDRAFARMGIDSWTVLGLYAGSLIMLFVLRGQ